MNEKKLPDYVVFDPKTTQQMPEHKILRKEAKVLTFPLAQSDLDDIKTIEKKFDEEKNMAGLAAVQIGIKKQIIIFSCDDLSIKKFRPDLIQMMPKTIWINPSYTGIEEEGMSEDYEGCFSVKDVVCIVKRYNKIRYKAQDINGNFIEGEAEGFLARIIQHEIDHVKGILCIDRASSYVEKEQFKKIREKYE